MVTTVTTASHSLAGVVPGDVIQFRDVTLVHTTTHPNGSWSSTTKTADHHTAIVESVSGSTITVFEQNVGSCEYTRLRALHRPDRDLRPQRPDERDDVDLPADQPELMGKEALTGLSGSEARSSDPETLDQHKTWDIEGFLGRLTDRLRPRTADLRRPEGPREPSPG